MLYWDKYNGIGHVADIKGKKKFYDNNIYTFDIETSSYFILDGVIHPPKDYLKLSQKEKDRTIKRSHMYIWMFGINDMVYFGRTWDELKEFLKRVNDHVPDMKYLFIHNQSFEFQFLKSNFHFEDVMARKAHKVITSVLRDYNFTIRCSYMMSNTRLANLTEMFGLDIKKKTGDLDYNLIRNPNTPLTEKEYGYCEYDILVLYEYIKKELEVYEDVKHIPTTNTGKVRRELYNLVMTDYKYKRIVQKAINTNPHIYNLLCDSFMGGYTHANWIFADTVLKNIDSYDIASSYPFVLCTYKYPSSEFKPCGIRRREDMSKRFAYLLVVKFKNVECKYFNNFISASKCRNLRGAKYDNGRLMSAKEFEITLTDIDFYFFLDTYKCSYEILECYYATLAYLPIKLINFILDKYVGKTELKNVEGKEMEYGRIKGMYNAIFGMTVTNTIRDDVLYHDFNGTWEEKELTNEEIVEKLKNEQKKGFLSFSWGVWCTSYARNNLLRRVIELDENIVYCDTDSAKLTQGYDKGVFERYNDSVRKRIKLTSKLLRIPEYRFSPKDIKGIEHTMGLFELETEKGRCYTYDEFITQGAKKYAYNIDGINHITVSGVPKSAAKSLKSLDDFRDNYVFEFEDGEKNILYYTEEQPPLEVTDYLGNSYLIKDRSGCCILPTTYELSKALDYAILVNDEATKRARYKEG